jgi:hypothetical protein
MTEGTAEDCKTRANEERGNRKQETGNGETLSHVESAGPVSTTGNMDKE